MGREAILKAALDNPTAAANIYNREELYSCIDDIAQRICKPGETIHQARVRAGSSPEGQAVMAAYAIAARPKPAENVARDPVEELRKSMDGGDVIGEIDKIASKIAREENVSMVKARALAWSRNEALRAKYDQRRTYRVISAGRA